MNYCLFKCIIVYALSHSCLLSTTATVNFHLRLSYIMMKLNNLSWKWSQQVNQAKALLLVLSLGCKCYFIFSSGVKNRTVICKNCRNIFRCFVEMMKKMR